MSRPRWSTAAVPISQCDKVSACEEVLLPAPTLQARLPRAIAAGRFTRTNAATNGASCSIGPGVTTVVDLPRTTTVGNPDSDGPQI